MQHIPCPSLSPGVCSDSCALSQGWPSNHLILCHPLLLPSIFPSIRVFSNKLAFHIRWPKYWSFSFSISPSNEYSGLISFRNDWFDLLAIYMGLSRVFSSTTFQKHRFFCAQPFYGPERVTGRKARGLQKEEIGCKCQTLFISVLSGGRKQTSVKIFSPLYEFKKRFLLKFCVAVKTPGSS